MRYQELPPSARIMPVFFSAAQMTRASAVASRPQLKAGRRRARMPIQGPAGLPPSVRWVAGYWYAVRRVSEVNLHAAGQPCRDLERASSQGHQHSNALNEVAAGQARRAEGYRTSQLLHSSSQPPLAAGLADLIAWSIDRLSSTSATVIRPGQMGKPAHSKWAVLPLLQKVAQFKDTLLQTTVVRGRGGDGR